MLDHTGSNLCRGDERPTRPSVAEHIVQMCMFVPIS